ncbi:MAG: hypothetical protein BWY72_00552 [Bacteroidetes bacterium ADurb.Bin416]|nr:MAG: hypothetical protein BWY72_00552 [Bacteroidetes bacterium ADurb.Bin416]
MTTHFKAITIPHAHVSRGIPITVGPTLINDHGFGGRDAIKAIVAVEPGPAAPEYIAHAAFGRMPAETVGVSTFFILRCYIGIVVRVAIEHQVVATFGEVKAYGLTVVHGQLFVGVVAALVAETLGLGVLQDGHLDAHHLKTFKMQVGSVHLKSSDTVTLRLDGAEVEHGQFPRVGPVADGSTGQPAFVHQMYIRPDVFVLGHLRNGHLINTST